jgi:site-specific recombinase XerD
MKMNEGNAVSSPYASASEMKTTFKFHLHSIKERGKGMVYTCTRVGSVVVARKSTGVVVIKKYWKNSRVTANHPDYLEINKTLQRILNGGPRSVGSDYKSCMLEYFNWHNERRYREGGITNTTYNTYQKIRLVLAKGILREFKSSTFPFEWLKDKEALDKLKEVIRLKFDGHGFREKRTSSNYLSVLKVVVSEWAERMEVNDLGMFNRLEINWKRREVSKARVLSDDELNKLRTYEPCGKSRKQNDSKSMFLFSIASSGQRVVDVITLRTTNFKPGYKILYKVKKVKTDFEVDFNYEMMEALSWIYPKFYEESCTNVLVSNAQVDYADMYKLISQIGFVDNFGTLNLLRLNQYIEVLKDAGWDKKNQHREFWSALVKLVFEMRDKASHLFFDKIRKLPSQFVFPYLREEDFIGVNWDQNFMSLEQTSIVYRAIAKYNRSLGRISEAMKIMPFTSHSARHTYAKQLKDMDFSVEQIQHSLNHANYLATKVYLETRFDNGIAKEVAKDRYQKRRNL